MENEEQSKAFEAWLQRMAARGGTTNVAVFSPNNPLVGGRYLSFNEEGGKLKPGQLVGVTAGEPSPAMPYSREWVLALARHGIKPNDWGSLVDEAEAEAAFQAFEATKVRIKLADPELNEPEAWWAAIAEQDRTSHGHPLWSAVARGAVTRTQLEVLRGLPDGDKAFAALTEPKRCVLNAPLSAV